MIRVVEAVQPPLAPHPRDVPRATVLEAIHKAEQAKPLTPARARGVHEQIVATGEDNTPPPVEAPLPPTDTPAPVETPAASDAAKPETQEVARRNETKALVTEYANLLLDIKDTRALIMAQAAAAGDTPLGDQYREAMLTQLMAEPPTVPSGDPRLTTLSSRTSAIVATQQPFAASAFAEFMRGHGFADAAEQLAKMDGKARMEQMNLLITQAEGKNPGAIAQAFVAEMTGGNKMPRTAEEIAATLGGQPGEKTAAVQNLMRKESMDALKSSIRDQLTKRVPSPASLAIGILMSIQFLNQMMGESTGGGH